MVNNGIYNTLYYIGEYVATEVYPIINIFEDSKESQLDMVNKREECFKKIFESEEYGLMFHPEFNPLALYYFIKYYKKINKEKLYDIFLICYQSISFGFDNIPSELYDEVFKYAPDTKNVINHIKEDYPNSCFEDNDKLIIYRSQGSKSTPLEKAYSWTTDYNVAKRFQKYNNGIILKGKIKIKNIIDYLPDCEHELLGHYKDIEFISVI